jgi:hypothetical protein
MKPLYVVLNIYVPKLEGQGKENLITLNITVTLRFTSLPHPLQPPPYCGHPPSLLQLPYCILQTRLIIETRLTLEADKFATVYCCTCLLGIYLMAYKGSI